MNDFPELFSIELFASVDADVAKIEFIRAECMNKNREHKSYQEDHGSELAQKLEYGSHTMVGNVPIAQFLRSFLTGSGFVGWRNHSRASDIP